MEQKIIIRDLRNGDWFWANRIVLESPYLTPATKVVYCALASFTGKKQTVYPSIRTICRLASVKRNTAVSSIKQLEKYKFIEADRKIGKVTRYTLLKLTDNQVVQNLNQFKKDTRVGQKRYRGSTKGIHEQNGITKHINNKGLNKFKTSKRVVKEKMKV